MRRGRTIREYRNKKLRHQPSGVSERRKKTIKKIVETKIQQEQREKAIARRRAYERQRVLRRKKTRRRDYKDCPAHRPFDMEDFVSQEKYEYSSRPVTVCHVIESVGLGGAQIMMLELVNGLNKYYGDNIHNYVVCLSVKAQKPNEKLYGSYGVIPGHVHHKIFKKFCSQNKIDIILQHRISASKCIKGFLPDNVKYVLLNHTFHNRYAMSEFLYCDLYISVCDFLDQHIHWLDFIHATRKRVILNGVENDYLDDIKPHELEGSLKTGRCHRLVPSKFNADSLHWMARQVIRTIPGFTHYLMGTSGAAKSISKKHPKILKYMGGIMDRKKKMSIIKALDVYFYETSQAEGASMAILESLASGVPVICKPLGGSNELVTNGVNGFLVADKSDFLLRMQQLAGNRKLLKKMKENALEDFNNRLHIKNVACKYMQVFEHVLKEKIDADRAGY